MSAPELSAWGVTLAGDVLAYEGGPVVRVHPSLLDRVRAELSAAARDRAAPWPTVVALSLGTMGRRARPYLLAGVAWSDSGTWVSRIRAYGSLRLRARRGPWPLPPALYPRRGSLP